MLPGKTFIIHYTLLSLSAPAAHCDAGV